MKSIAGLQITFTYIILNKFQLVFLSQTVILKKENKHA